MTVEARLAEIMGRVHALQGHDAWPITKAVRFAIQGAIDTPALIAALEAVLAIHEQAVCTCLEPGCSLAEQNCRDCSQKWPCVTVKIIAEALGVTEK